MVTEVNPSAGKYHISVLVIQIFLVGIYIFILVPMICFWSLPRLFVFGRLCFNLRQCYLCSSCTAGLYVYRSCSEKVPCGTSCRLYQFSDV